MLAVTILLTVGLGIGAATLIYAADAALLRPPKILNRLMWVYTHAPPFMFPFSLVDYLALQEQQTHFERVAAFTDRSMSYSDGVSAELLRGRAVSWTLLRRLGNHARARPRLHGKRWPTRRSRGDADAPAYLQQRLWAGWTRWVR